MSTTPHDPLTPAQQRELLHVARRTLEVYFDTKEEPTFEVDDPRLQVPAGAFVTLHRRAPTANEIRLRGCIGTFEANDPVIRTVTRMALSAALHDPRFPSVTRDELPRLEIEISVLSPRQRVEAEAVEVGRHGIYITQGSRRGVLLPQVATEHAWDAPTVLAQTCRKAGLPMKAWRDAETTIEVFTAQVFGEEILTRDN